MEDGLERNKALVRRIFAEAWNRQELAGIAPHIDPQMAFHFRGRTRPLSAADLAQVIAAWHRAFADLHFEVKDMVAEGERVAARLTFSGRQQGQWKGITSSGQTVTVTMMMFFRFEDGRLVEAWEDYDEFGLWQQLGAL